ncbi:hypothetical protein LXA43DRAFT_887857 [Ganoderma leucocontextum]|nr:hypothetical protein LXA43DRAFT_887857 [Ganoderma leucocontextum]
MTLASLSPAGAQDKLNQFSEYTAEMFVLTNVPKTLALMFGPLPDPFPILYLRDECLSWVDSARYTGIHFSTSHADMFAAHYTRKEQTARAAANAALSVESHIGTIPATTARMLYLAHVEPHLVFGCEVALDVRANALKSLEDLQRTYLRRLLKLSAHSQVIPLFTETGIWPVRYRRMDLVLRYAKYLVDSGPVLPRLALQEVVALARAPGCSGSWWSDVQHALGALPVPVRMDWHGGPTSTNLDKARNDLASEPSTMGRASLSPNRRRALACV